MEEWTLAILKLDCIQNDLAGQVITHLLQEKFKIIGLKMVRLTKETAGEFYAVHRGRPFYDDLISFMSESRVVAIALERENAMSELRSVIGATDPKEAEAGTIRKLYAESKSRNIIHASDSLANGQIELNFFFSSKELIENI